jgi:hypothetical protein
MENQKCRMQRGKRHKEKAENITMSAEHKRK